MWKKALFTPYMPWEIKKGQFRSQAYYNRHMPGRRAAITRRRANYRRPSRYPAPEHKFFDTTIDLAPVISTSTFNQSLLTIAEGDGENEREGRKISITGITTKIHLILNENSGASLPGTHNAVKVCLVLDTQTNGAIPTTSDYEVLPNTFLSFRNLSNSGRFKTLWTRIYTQNATAAAGDGAVNDSGTFATDDVVHYKFKKPLVIQYNNSVTTGAIASVESNCLFLYFKGRHNFSSIFTNTRVRFYG